MKRSVILQRAKDKKRKEKEREEELQQEYYDDKIGPFENIGDGCFRKKSRVDDDN